MNKSIGSMRNHPRNKLISFVIASLAAASFLMVVMQLFFYTHSRNEMQRFADNLISIEATRASETLAVQLKSARRMVEAIARDLDSRKLDDRELSSRLSRILEAQPNIFTVGVAYAPDVSGTVRAVQYGRSGGVVTAISESLFLENAANLLKTAASDKKTWWTEPYRDKTSGEIVVGLVLPIKDGILYATMSSDTIRRVAGAFRFGDTGYGYILSKTGRFIYHPINEAVESQKTIFEISAAQKSPNAKRLMEATKKALAGGRSSVDIANPETGQHFRVFYKSISDTGWVLAGVFSKEEILADEGFFRKQKIWMTLSIIIFLTLLSAVVFRVDTLQASRLWLVSSSFSIVCMAGAFYIWNLTLSAPLIEEKDKKIFTDMVSVNRFIETSSRTFLSENRRPPAYIPTGIYIQSLEFEDSNDLNITGYIWQSYTDGKHDGIKQGFILPEARTISVKEAYRSKTGPVETVGWYFEATTRQIFDYSKFPFDRPNIWIWLRHIDFINNIVLVPDLASYKFLAPSSMPGLQEEVALPGYTFLGTFFDHEYHIRRTTFGMQAKDRIDRMPEIYYNIIVKRNFITPFVSKLFPLFIMFAILFVVQLMFSRDEEKKKAFGLSAFAVMGVVITFFFSTLLSHTNLRQDLGSDRIIFVENFHFIAYILLLLVTIKTLLFMGGRPIRFIHYKNGLIPKLFYWPLFTGFVFAVSFIHFYR